MEKNLTSLIEKHGLAHVQDDIIASVYKCITVTPKRSASLPPGISKFGGAPDLPEEMEYPVYKNIPLNFIGQVNLTELAALAFEENQLPKEGMLYFFYYDNWEEDDDVVYGEPDQKDGWRVLHWDGDVTMLRPVERAKASYPPCKMNFSIVEKLPYIFLETEEDEEKFEELHDEWHSPGSPEHQIFGLPISIQGEVFDEVCDYVEAEEDEMILLLQVDSDEENLDVMWGDCGMIYYCISRRDLAEKRFDRSWFSFQCH
ncbi:YwqG family protein [Bacillus sp. B190/17]|uniref:YwqG family protein n=1 Tax=Bacillus lumedeiriae TaxID=3058829 RepID=A0ABW8I791_9BACI